MDISLSMWSRRKSDLEFNLHQLMVCTVDIYRSSIGPFVPTLLVILRKRAQRAAMHWKERKLQSAMAMFLFLFYEGSVTF